MREKSMETWLKPNRRGLLLGACAPAAFVAIGLTLALGSIAALDVVVVRIFGWVIVAAAGLLIIALVRAMFLPRIGYDGERVLFFLRSGSPIAVEVELVEGFLLGQSTVDPADERQRAEALNVVVRLSQREESLDHRPVNPSLGWWCDGYVTIRGTWCEPLDEDLVRGLNARLGEAHERIRQAK
jgi:hypothetical protein